MDFVNKRYICFALSLLVIISGIVFGVIKGYKFDIDFKGGTKIETELKAEFKNTDVENIVAEITGSKPLVQQVANGDNKVIITSDVMSEEQSTNVVNALKEKFPDMSEPSTRNVQPSYGKELLESALLAVCVALVLILLYITIRFKTLGFTAAVTAIIALLHDALFIIAIYGIFGLTINTSFVAVILTIIGYSINDTIIIYDRIRENKRKVSKSNDDKDTINKSISQTIKRTIYTSLTTVTVIAVVYVMSLIDHQQVLKEFSLPLVIGVLVGTYSSVFIAPSLWYVFDNISAKLGNGKSKKNSKKK